MRFAAYLLTGDQHLDVPAKGPGAPVVAMLRSSDPAIPDGSSDGRHRITFTVFGTT